MRRKKQKVYKKQAVNQDHMIESVSHEEIEVTDPATGKKIKKTVKVIKYKARPFLSNSALDALKELDDTQTFHEGEDAKE